MHFLRDFEYNNINRVENFTNKILQLEVVIKLAIKFNSEKKYFTL